MPPGWFIRRSSRPPCLAAGVFFLPDGGIVPRVAVHFVCTAARFARESQDGHGSVRSHVATRRVAPHFVRLAAARRFAVIADRGFLPESCDDILSPLGDSLR